MLNTASRTWVKLAFCKLTCLLNHSVVSKSFVTSWTIAHQAPWTMGCSRQECFSGLPFPLQGIFPDSGTEHASSCLLHWPADSLPPAPVTPPCHYLPDFLGLNVLGSLGNVWYPFSSPLWTLSWMQMTNFYLGLERRHRQYIGALIVWN